MNYACSFSTDVINITWCQREMKNFEMKKEINYEEKAPENWRRCGEGEYKDLRYVNNNEET